MATGADGIQLGTHVEDANLVSSLSRLALVIGVGFAVILLAWTIMRTISEGFGWPYYGWPYSG